jgi:ferrochelatase
VASTGEVVFGENRARWGVLLLAHGAPDRLEDIPEFLLHVRGGRALPDAAVEEIIRRYRLIGGGSPLLAITAQQAQALAEALAHPVYVGMRNWKPFLADAVRNMREEGIERVVALCLAPQNSRTSIGLYKQHLNDAVETHAPQLSIDFIENWHDHPLLIQAFAEKVAMGLAQAQAQAEGPVPVVFTAHSVPERTILEGDPYAEQVRETARLVAEALELDTYRLAFQSQGMTPEPWIGPTVESQIDELAELGRRHVLLAPVGFVSDHVEILYDIDILFRKYGRDRGVTIHRSESLNDSPLFIKALTEIISTRVVESSKR